MNRSELRRDLSGQLSSVLPLILNDWEPKRNLVPVSLRPKVVDDEICLFDQAGCVWPYAEKLILVL